MYQHRIRSRTTVVVLTSLLTMCLGIAAASAAAAAPIAGGGATPTWLPTTTETLPASPTPAPTSPMPSPTIDPTADPICEAQCGCEEATPEPSGTPTFVTAGWRPRAAAPDDLSVTVTFTVKTDANKRVTGFKPETDVEVKKADYRDYVTGETAANDPRGCYKASFDSRRFEECEIIEKTAWINVVDGMTGKIEAVMLTPTTLRDEDGSEYARYFFTWGPKQANMIFIIKLKCALRQ